MSGSPERYRPRGVSIDQDDATSAVDDDQADAPIDISAILSGVNGEEYVDRSKIKEISRLIIERDAAKFGFLHLKVPKEGESPKKKYVPKFIAIT